MVLEEYPIDSLKRPLQRGYLFHNFRAVALLINHANDTVKVSAHSLEPIECISLMLFFHAAMIPPHRGRGQGGYPSEI